MLKRRKKTTMQSIKQQNPIPAPVSVEPSLSDLKAQLDQAFRDCSALSEKLHRHLKDESLTAEAELHTFIWRLASVCRDARDGMRTAREIAGVRT
jgi:hypothetical protein